uniref:Uncharacterized protein n=1 Tax=Chromera velia CCMP2878 TaxID=1169474 RepID=A0A0G4I7X7_9ALVE|mmetsp:Transcript_6243/g.12332  ORF Transcript_6243/g.12332 Transcript_6243/m.12332 type:complete len:155 (-) Transcript_6243:207-671(-)|eukprot:Cvel_11801.t1-p1 / transcript=Cvel_11801.t1 / gene=Cvel_11801 / organism=Chromera_velia_CCMP2878 / gene_product=hypothetical protein / transcript_product=hypothetical protein / location=Cvel_scaffold750:68129-68590(+) / protein_length=154 / sequence_SO=supercontig / SO=protein_coding / is_pseudo=false
MKTVATALFCLFSVSGAFKVNNLLSAIRKSAPSSTFNPVAGTSAAATLLSPFAAQAADLDVSSLDAAPFTQMLAAKTIDVPMISGDPDRTDNPDAFPVSLVLASVAGIFAFIYAVRYTPNEYRDSETGDIVIVDPDTLEIVSRRPGPGKKGKKA